MEKVYKKLVRDHIPEITAFNPNVNFKCEISILKW